MEILSNHRVSKRIEHQGGEMMETTYSTTSEIALQITALKKSYGKVQALRGIDLEIYHNEIFGFLGPNGAGKTTTIRCLLDMIRPDSGLIRVLGLDPRVNSVELKALIGYLPGEMQFYENLNAERQLRYLNDLRGRKADWDYVRELALRLDLDIKQPIKNLSKGNKQKVGVIQALMHRPKMLLLDEPTSGLDPLIQQKVLALILDANRNGSTVFFSSHIMSEVESIAGRVAIIRSGEIVEVADTSILTQRSLRKMTVRFKQPIDSSRLENLPGVNILAYQDGKGVTMQVKGDMDELIKALGDYPVQDLETSHTSLEDAFLAYYKK